MTATYAWKITNVNVAEIGDDCADEVGICGPRDADPKLLEQLKTSGLKDGHLFRMLDDDGIWYYRGVILFAEGEAPVARQITMNPGEQPRWIVCGGLDAEGAEEADFGPLWDFGTPNAGCTEIQYRVFVTDEDGDRVKVWASL